MDRPVQGMDAGYNHEKVLCGSAAGQIIMSDFNDFLPYFTGIRKRTARLVPLIPPDRIEWRPSPGAMSFGDLLRHLAGTERWMWAENVAGRPARFPGHDESLAAGYEATCAYFERLHGESMAIFETLSREDYEKPVQTPAGARLPAWKWLRAMIEHEAHHRGQLYLMLRTIGVATPPIFGLTAEEVRERSA
jgi:uncharacterized damage-inducible protein DinB